MKQDCSIQYVYFITFHYKNDLLAERSCNRTYSQLKKQINEMKCTSTGEHTQSGYNKPLLVGHLTVEALEMVRK